MGPMSHGLVCKKLASNTQHKSGPKSTRQTIEITRWNLSARKRVSETTCLHKFGFKYATQKRPEIGRGASRRALFWAPGVSRICGQICAKIDFSKPVFSNLAPTDPFP